MCGREAPRETSDPCKKEVEAMVRRYPYAIFYRVAGDAVLILHIRHTAQKPIDPETES